MKRNETILVYAVTGLLLVILLVAVVFGESKAPIVNASEGMNSPKIAVLPGIAPVNPASKAADPKTNAGAASNTEIASREDDGGQAKGTAGSAIEAILSNAGKDGVASAKSGPEIDIDGGVGPVDLSAKIVTADMKLENVLGTSRRMENFRVVKSRRGDTLRKVVERWCADVQHLPDAEAANESLIEGSLPAGREVVVPWVEAEVILAAETVRASNAAKVEHAKGQLYSLKKGDSLWKLAKSKVGQNQLVPAWIERFKQLNPEITDPSVLVVGQKVRLPRLPR